MSAIGPVSAVSPATSAASQAEAGSVRAAVAIELQRKSVNMQAEAAAKLLAAMLPVDKAAPPLASEGSVGTQLNEVA